MFDASHYVFGGAAVVALFAAMWFVPATYGTPSATPRVDATAITLTAKDLSTQGFDAI